MEPTEVVAAGYDRLAVGYDDWTATVLPELRVGYVEDLIPLIRPGGRVLELGCGTGRPIAQMLATDFDYLGVDISAGMLDAAQRACPDGRFVLGDMTLFEADEGVFAGVVAFYSIIHVPRRSHSELIGAISRWLEPGGWFVASLGTVDEEAGTDDNWLGAGEMYWSTWDSDRNLTLLSDAGFEIVDTQILDQKEGDDPVQFHWVVCQKPRS